MKEKTSFIMYSMWGEQIEKLSDEQAGKLIKSIFRYAQNGEKPQSDDLALDILLSIICNQLDMDGEKWEDIREKRSQAVKKRWNKGKSETDTNEYKSIQTDTNSYKRIQNDTNDTVNVNVNENVNDYVNENENVNDNVCTGGFAEARPHNQDAELVFGEFRHVRLTASEHERLVSDFGKKLTDEYIRKVDEYTEQTGKAYKSCYITIRKWINKDNAQEQPETIVTDAEREFFRKIVNNFD